MGDMLAPGAMVVSGKWRANTNLASPPVTCDITQETNPLKECPEVPPLPSTPRAAAWHHGNLPGLLVGGNLTLSLFEPISSFFFKSLLFVYSWDIKEPGFSQASLSHFSYFQNKIEYKSCGQDDQSFTGAEIRVSC